MHTYPITQEQLQLLDRMHCERVSSDSSNLERLMYFFCPAAYGIESFIRQRVYAEDTATGSAAYYVVKDQHNEILMVFGLKCGTLFNTDYASSVTDAYARVTELETAATNYHDLLHEIYHSSGTASQRESRIRAANEYHHLMFDIQADPNPHNIRVSDSIPAIELVFCAVNDMCRSNWQKLGLPHGMGETLFWHFVVPKVLEINNLIGCKYLYTFLADDSGNGSLQFYFRDRLHFEEASNLGTAKSSFDFGCSLYYQLLHPDRHDAEKPNLLENRRNFYREFNLSPADDDLV